MQESHCTVTQNKFIFLSGMLLISSQKHIEHKKKKIQRAFVAAVLNAIEKSFMLQKKMAFLSFCSKNIH